MPPRLYQSHPASLNVLFGSIEGHIQSGAPVFCGTAGSVAIRTNQQGFEFYAHRFYDGDGKQREVYVSGPVGDAEADAKASDLKARIDEVKAQVADVRLLGREGYQLVDTKTYATLASLHLHGIFQAGAMLIGSHAFGVILNHLGVRTAAYTTDDIDIARRGALALPEPLEKSLLEILKESGISFIEVPQLDPRAASTSFKQRGTSRFHVDLLVPSADESFRTIAVPELRAHAISLPYLGYVLGQSQSVALLAHEGVCLVRVPLPERFALHKLLVSQLRGTRDAKSQKDIYQASVLLAALGDLHPGAIEDAANDVPDSGVKYVRKALQLVQPMLEDAYPRAWEELTTALN